MPKVQFDFEDINLGNFVLKFGAAYINNQTSHRDILSIINLYEKNLIDILISTLTICCEYGNKCHNIIVRSPCYYNDWSDTYCKYETIHLQYAAKLFIQNENNKIVLIRGSSSNFIIDRIIFKLESRLTNHLLTHYVESEFIRIKMPIKNLTINDYHNNSYYKMTKNDKIRIIALPEVPFLNQFVCLYHISLSTAQRLISLIIENKDKEQINIKQFVRI